MLLSSRNTFVCGKWTIQQFGITKHLSSNHELGELDDFKCIVWRKSINMCLWKQGLDKGIISVRVRTQLKSYGVQQCSQSQSPELTANMQGSEVGESKKICQETVKLNHGSLHGQGGHGTSRKGHHQSSVGRKMPPIGWATLVDLISPSNYKYSNCKMVPWILFLKKKENMSGDTGEIRSKSKVN